MEAKTTTFQSATGLGPILVREYPVDHPKGIVQINHGMLEHFGRYDAFARFLNIGGYYVVGYDLAGHGLSTPDAPRGFFGSKEGVEHLLKDIRTLQEKISREHPGVPYFQFGHSMGALLVSAYCEKNAGGLRGAIIMGTSGPRQLMATVGCAIATLFPKKKHLMFFRSMTFAGYNKTYPKPSDRFAWISSDPEAVSRYKADPLRIETFTARGFYDLGMISLRIARPDWYKNMPKELPILFVSGANDPVGQYSSGVRQVGKKLVDEGAKDVQITIYPDARHEVLNEFDQAKVKADILAWLNLHAHKA
jgi:alpha-beta hydrolase superfamily lysophospholipase